MKKGYIAVLFIAAFVIGSKQQIAAQTVTFVSTAPQPFTTTPSDTIYLESACFVRVIPKKTQPLRLDFCDAGFCVTDQAGNPAPYSISGISLSFPAAQGYFDIFVHAGQYDIIRRYMQNVAVGSAIQFYAGPFFDSKGKKVIKACNGLEYKRIK